MELPTLSDELNAVRRTLNGDGRDLFDASMSDDASASDANDGSGNDDDDGDMVMMLAVLAPVPVRVGSAPVTLRKRRRTQTGGAGAGANASAGTKTPIRPCNSPCRARRYSLAAAGSLAGVPLHQLHDALDASKRRRGWY